MKYRNTYEFPSWVKDYHFTCGEYPSGYKQVAKILREIGNDVAEKWHLKGKSEIPYNQGEINAHMNADDGFYESYPIFCANKGSRPNEWDHLYDSDLKNIFSRHRDFYEIKIGEWYIVVGFDYD